LFEPGNSSSTIRLISATLGGWTEERGEEVTPRR